MTDDKEPDWEALGKRADEIIKTITPEHPAWLAYYADAHQNGFTQLVDNERDSPERQLDLAYWIARREGKCSHCGAATGGVSQPGLDVCSDCAASMAWWI